MNQHGGSSAILFHGPGAESAAHTAAKLHGLVVPFGASGEALKKDDARELVALLTQTPVGSRAWAVAVGPLDEISPAVADVLLKTLEDFNPAGIRPFLWAWDLGGVIPTIRSRCLQEFVPGEDERIVSSRTQAEKLVSAYIQKNWTDLVTELKESKGDEEFVLLATVEVLQSRLGEEPIKEDLLRLWGSLRNVFMTREAPFTPARVLSAFMVGLKT
jgi:hypothetical protein